MGKVWIMVEMVVFEYGYYFLVFYFLIFYDGFKDDFVVCIDIL